MATNNVSGFVADPTNILAPLVPSANVTMPIPGAAGSAAPSAATSGPPVAPNLPNSAASGIQAVPVPTGNPVGFNPALSSSDLVINGSQITADATAALSRAELERTITGASTLTLTLEDPFRKWLTSPLANIVAPTTPGANAVSAPASSVPGQSAFDYQPTTVAITDGTESLTFALVQIAKTSDELTLTFEDKLINQLRYCFPESLGTNGLVAASTVTRADFMALVINIGLVQLSGNVTMPQLAYPPAGTPGVQLLSKGDQQSPLTWGGTQDTGGSSTVDSGTGAGVTEDAWSCLVRLANAAQWRCFSDGTTIWFGPDDWLLSAPVAASVVERALGLNATPGITVVDNIDMDWDIGKAQATLDITAVAALLTWPPGAIVGVAGVGIATGNWIVSDLVRQSLFLPDVNIECVQAQPPITESMLAALATSGASAPTAANASGQSTVTSTTSGPGGGSAFAQAAVAAARTQQGVAYVYGGETAGAGFDCSGLVQWAYAQAGVSVPRTSEDQWAAYQGNAVPQPWPDNLVPGDLVFTEFGEDTPGEPGHVGIYIGSGQVLQAPYTGTNVGLDTFADFTSGQSTVAVERPSP
ncbi:MAG: C40 family peptidase [Acidimicrobiales bacterium]